MYTGKEFEFDSMLCPLDACNEIGRQKSVDKPRLECSKNTQCIGATCWGSKFNIDDDVFVDEELLDDGNDDDHDGLLVILKIKNLRLDCLNVKC